MNPLPSAAPAAGEPGRGLRAAANLVARALCLAGAPRAFDALWGKRRVTVLAYHRIADVHAPGFQYLADNVSASPAMFAWQMAYVKRHFNVVDLGTFIDAVAHGRPLPDRALLITFDDGYYDNYEHAFPVLKQLGLPAVCFLVTGQMGVARIPWWDAVAYAFRATPCRRAVLPLIGECDLSTAQRRARARNTLLGRLKLIYEDEKQRALAMLLAALEVAAPTHDPRLFMSWEHVRELVKHGVACQPHTVTHPILSRIEPERMQHELEQSFAEIAARTGAAPVAFAYPNGLTADYNVETQRALHRLGCKAAFTLSPRVIFAEDLPRRPLELPRVYLNYRDTPDVFALKVMGLPALRLSPFGASTTASTRGLLS